MSNSTCTASFSLSYPLPSTAQDSFSLTASCPFQGQSIGMIDVPSGAVTGATYSIPFGSIGTEATCLLVKNTLSTEIKLTVNGATMCDLAAGGLMMVANAATNAANPLASAMVTIAGTQGEAGLIKYWVMGDPT